jgi:hypothetical protein
MKSIDGRIRRLEISLLAQDQDIVLVTQHLAHVLWERRQRRLKVEGLPLETVEPQYSRTRYMSLAETLHMRRQERVDRLRQELETGANGT